MAIGDALRIFKSVEGLLTFEAKQKGLLATLEGKVASLERRVPRLEVVRNSS